MGREERVSKKRIYISGPITGQADNNYHAFKEAEHRFERAGWSVINPLTLAGAGEKEWTEYMKVDLVVMLMAADAIAILPLWWGSTGSRVELVMAKVMRLPVYNAKTMQIFPLDIDVYFNGKASLQL